MSISEISERVKTTKKDLLLTYLNVENKKINFEKEIVLKKDEKKPEQDKKDVKKDVKKPENDKKDVKKDKKEDEEDDEEDLKISFDDILKEGEKFENDIKEQIKIFMNDEKKDNDDLFFLKKKNLNLKFKKKKI
jgi:hypothetical protein